MDGTSTGEAQSAVAEAVATAVENANENTSEVIAAVVENAADRIDAAHEAAQQIADAAAATALAQQFQDFQREVRSWLDGLESKLLKIPAMEEAISTLQGQMAATATLAVSHPVQSLSTPPVSDKIAEATAEVAEILPANLENVAEESPAPAIRKARRLWT